AVHCVSGGQMLVFVVAAVQPDLHAPEQLLLIRWPVGGWGAGEHVARRFESGCGGTLVWSFFFSSRRRHTRFSRDWSSDVCSSDLAFPVLLAGGLLLVFDRSFGTSFFLSDIYIGGEALPNQGGSAVLYQHLFWFLGHPEVYIVLLPALGIVSEVIATNSRKPIFGYTAMIG